MWDVPEQNQTLQNTTTSNFGLFEDLPSNAYHQPPLGQQNLGTSQLPSYATKSMKVKITKRNAKYLHELQKYPHKVEERYDSDSDKFVPTFVWEYGGNCGAEFQRSWNLLDHLYMHYGIKPYGCHICSQRFTQKGNLNKHLLKHKSELTKSEDGTRAPIYL